MACGQNASGGYISWGDAPGYGEPRPAAWADMLALGQHARCSCQAHGRAATSPGVTLQVNNPNSVPLAEGHIHDRDDRVANLAKGRASTSPGQGPHAFVDLLDHLPIAWAVDGIEACQQIGIGHTFRQVGGGGHQFVQVGVGR